MSIENEKTLEEFLKDIGNCIEFTIDVKDEEDFRGDFDKNPILADILNALRSIRPISLRQMLRLGGYQVCEAGINIAMHGIKGSTTITLYVGDRGVVYEIKAAGDGFDVKQTLKEFASGDTYFHHKGYGLKSFDRPHISVTFSDGGRTTIIECLFASEGKFYENYIESPIVNTSIEVLKGKSLREAALSTDTELRDALNDFLHDLKLNSEQNRHIESPEWGYYDIVNELQHRLREYQSFDLTPESSENKQRQRL